MGFIGSMRFHSLCIQNHSSVSLDPELTLGDQDQQSVGRDGDMDGSPDSGHCHVSREKECVCSPPAGGTSGA